MKVIAIKDLVDNQSIDELKEAESAIFQERPLEINVEGDDEGERLTHVIAATWILQRMKDDHLDFKTALKEYTNKVRESIN